MKPRIPQGTRDFTPEIVRKRNHILSVLKNIFETFGFEPIETPALEQLETLMGKYGDEGDQLIFKILNNGLDNPKKEEKTRAAFENVLSGKNDTNLTERALRYDLTIPFARFIVLHQNDLAFPFRRYQMQPVWRADRPQKGRYREFWQCDADIIGSDSLINEAELIQIYAQAFTTLNIPQIQIRINNRKILAGMAQACHASEKLTPITVAIDKMDKIGREGVVKELEKLELSSDQIDFIQSFLHRESDLTSELNRVESLLSQSKIGRQGLSEIKETLQNHELLGGSTQDIEVIFDCSLARGLNYYTGFIVEVITKATAMGSIGGGGRYDDLTGLFGLKNLSGVGISFGVDRIYDVMETLEIFPQNMNQPLTKILLLNIEEESHDLLLKLLQNLRAANIASELFPDLKKIDKQMKYANKRQIPFVGIIGSSELAQHSIQLKNMYSGEQESIAIKDFVQRVKTLLA